MSAQNNCKETSKWLTDKHKETVDAKDSVRVIRKIEGANITARRASVTTGARSRWARAGGMMIDHGRTRVATNSTVLTTVTNVQMIAPTTPVDSHAPARTTIKIVTRVRTSATLVVAVVGENLGAGVAKAKVTVWADIRKASPPEWDTAMDRVVPPEGRKEWTHIAIDRRARARKTEALTG